MSSAVLPSVPDAAQRLEDCPGRSHRGGFGTTYHGLLPGEVLASYQRELKGERRTQRWLARTLNPRQPFLPPAPSTRGLSYLAPQASAASTPAQAGEHRPQPESISLAQPHAFGVQQGRHARC